MKLLLSIALLLLAAGTAQAQDAAPTCDDLVWSAQVLAANPDIDRSCQGVYERAGELYARVNIELTRVRGNRITFRPRHTDGSTGRARSIVVPASWRARIGGRDYRASELLPGQELSVYIPEDRFALALLDDDADIEAEMELIAIEEADVVTTMPKTASPTATAIAVGFALFGLAAA